MFTSQADFDNSLNALNSNVEKYGWKV
ncbi:hypothetical protein EYZ11_008627 [Aspergillus tanneri]|uniref:Uncharacterized protein n=1 Tax=Aspergillus tanneri TaxID=1220188 RepID=A0A4S3JC61_9EURO|nr:hypothetical protein EYZ11_008627 [Aspergillus tanneri]